MAANKLAVCVGGGEYEQHFDNGTVGDVVDTRKLTCILCVFFLFFFLSFSFRSPRYAP